MSNDILAFRLPREDEEEEFLRAHESCSHSSARASSAGCPFVIVSTSSSNAEAGTSATRWCRSSADAATRRRYCGGPSSTRGPGWACLDCSSHVTTTTPLPSE